MYNWGWLLSGLVDRAALSCRHWFNVPVLFLTRWRATNPFHIMEDLTQTFISVMVARESLGARDVPPPLQLLMVDDMPRGPFFAAWDALFLSNPRLGHLRPLSPVHPPSHPLPALALHGRKAALLSEVLP